jgi:hypothetical protein
MFSSALYLIKPTRTTALSVLGIAEHVLSQGEGFNLTCKN